MFAGAKDRYIADLTRFREDGVAEWLEHFAAATVRAARLARAYVDAVRAKSRVYEAIEQLVDAGVLVPLSEGRRNRWWEAAGLLDLIARPEAGQLPPKSA